MDSEMKIKEWIGDPEGEWVKWDEAKNLYDENNRLIDLLHDMSARRELLEEKLVDQIDKNHKLNEEYSQLLTKFFDREDELQSTITDLENTIKRLEEKVAELQAYIEMSWIDNF